MRIPRETGRVTDGGEGLRIVVQSNNMFGSQDNGFIVGPVTIDNPTE